MRIVVNHLTRMQYGYICIAGIDPDTGKHVRPTPEGDRWRRPDLVRQGGPFDIAALVELGRASYDGHAPEVEDYRVRPTHARRQRDLTPTEFWDLLSSVARPRLREIFGQDLQQQSKSFAVAEGNGSASLGCLLLARPPILHLTRPDEVRLSFNADPQGPSIKVTDLRLYTGNAGSPAMARGEVVGRLNERMRQGVAVILSVGLGRPFQRDGDDTPRHWLQVNNIHLQDDPAWTERG